MQNDAATVKNSIVVPQKDEIELPYDLVIPLLGIYPTEMKAGTQTGICTPMFMQHYSQ